MICGRPFLIQHAVRLAKATRSDAWLDRAGPPVPETDAAFARTIAAHWTEIGLMEHASIAAFARFSLQLMALGAPMELVRDATTAQADELRHATLAFGLASAYGGSPIGPGPLVIDGALSQTSPEDVLRLTIREGCIGETVAALEAAEAGRGATVSTVKEILEGIAADESNHAALAWRVARWLLEKNPELLRVAEEELAAARAQLEVGGSPGPNDSTAHGVLDTRARARIRETAWREVIEPCAETLLAALAFPRSRGARSAQSPSSPDRDTSA
jgi:hypothetical protein